MKDELLIRFIDGNVTPEEQEKILKELSQDGNAAKEWLQMEQGARLAGTEPLQKISSEEFIAKTLAMDSAKTEVKTKTVSLSWLIGGLTAVAASVVMILSVMTNDGDHNLHHDILADTNDTISIEHFSDERPVELVGGRISKEDKAASEFQNTAPLFEMLMPPDTTYKIHVESLRSEFLFVWNAKDITSVRLYISDEHGEILIDRPQVLDNNCAIALSDIAGKGLLTWTAEVLFDDGTIRTYIGKLELISAE
jgi:hypothetical protein